MKAQGFAAMVPLCLWISRFNGHEGQVALVSQRHEPLLFEQDGLAGLHRKAGDPGLFHHLERLYTDDRYVSYNFV